MPDLTFWLLDITYGIKGSIPEIMMFGISENGEKVLVIDREFRPYFYAIPKQGIELITIIQKIRRKCEGKGLLNLEVVKRKIFGKERDVIKITVTIPEKVRKLREEIKKIEEIEDVLEADIRFYMRYLLDQGIKPCSWITVDHVEEIKLPGYKVDRVYVIKSKPRQIEEHHIPKLKVLAFDIEVYNPKGMPHPDKDPVIVITTMTYENGIKTFLANELNDRNVIKEFVEYVQTYDPDIIVGYNTNKFDWPYLTKRSERIGVPLRITRANSTPQQSVYGHWSIIGRANVDLYNIIEDMPDIKIKSLDYVAEYFGILKRSDRVLIPGHRIHEYWRDSKKRELLIKYAEQDVYSTFKLAEKLLPFLIQLSSISGLPLDQVATASVGARVEWMIMYTATKLGELAPNRIERPYEGYKGAIVLEPRIGIHENIAVLDFSSMYPSIMIKHNISPDTYIRPDENYEGEYYEAPEVHHRFRKEPPGLYKKILLDLIDARKKVRDLMTKLPKDSTDWIILNERQKALKILANAMYGYCGWIGARWYIKEVAEAVTAWGRSLLRSAIEFCKKIGLQVIYGDTDSLFVKNDEDKIRKLIGFVTKELGFEIKVEKIYTKVLFTEAKKRYIGLTSDGIIEIVGFEAARSDWADIAKETQEKVAEIVLKEGDIDKAIKYVHSVIQKLKEYKFNIDEVIIWKTLDKSLDEYKVLTAHVHAAKKLIEHGFRISKGDVIGYVIVKSGGKIAYKAMPYILVKDIHDVDVDYYIEKQVIPAALRILKVFGIREDMLLSGKKTRSILDFM